MDECSIKPEDVVFIAHGTTQATNALLEGDVAKVGIVTLGSGLQGQRDDTDMGKIELAQGKFLPTGNEYIDTNGSDLSTQIDSALDALQKDGCTSFVAAEAFLLMTLQMRTKLSKLVAVAGCREPQQTIFPSCMD